MKTIFICIGLIALFFMGCKKSEKPFYPIDPLVKDLFNWQPGSYWIMQDSATGQIDSFYIISYKSGVFTGSYDDNETLNINFDEVNISDTFPTVPWHIEVGEVGNQLDVQLGYYLFNNRDSAFSWISFFYNIPYSDIVLTFNGKSYSNVYYNSTAFFVINAPGYLSIAINKAFGFVYIKVMQPNYKRTWFLLRHHIITAK